jgi:hypothetical protein
MYTELAPDIQAGSGACGPAIDGKAWASDPAELRRQKPS